MSQFSAPNKPEHWAIILEGISFFLVTLDLYGKDRIHRNGIRLTRLIKRMRKVELRDKVVSFLQANRTYVFLFSALFFSSAIAVGYVVWVPTTYWVTTLIFWSLWLVISTVVVEVVVSIILSALTLYINFIEFTRKHIIALTLLLFRRYKLEGLLLILGAVLFCVSKAISYGYVH